MPRSPWPSLAALAGALASFAPSFALAEGPSPAGAGEVCIHEEAVNSLFACPGGAKLSARAEPKPLPRLSPAPESKGQERPPPPTVGNDAGKQIRLGRAAPRIKKLLLTELGQLEDLLKATAPRAADRPQLLRRLGDTYAELEGSAMREQTEAEVAKNKEQAEASRKVVESARASAIKHYTALADGHPGYPQLDEVLYFLAYEHEQGGKLDEARKVYYRLVNDAPQSRYVPNAYLAFGELFFTEAQTDPSKLELARQSYEKVLEYPEASTRVWGYAQYKLAYVQWSIGDRDALGRAMGSFKKVVEWADRHAGEPGSKPLADAARRDVVQVYARAGKPGESYAFFKPLADGKADRSTFAMMDALGQGYLDTGHYAEAVELYTDLIGRDKGDGSCGYQARLTQASMALKGGAQKPAVLARLEELSRRQKAFRAEAHDEAAKGACMAATAELLYETAAAWHIEAQGSGGVRGTLDKTTMKSAARLYGLLVEGFSRDDFARLEFPRIVKEDWPTLSRVKYQRADLLYLEGDWAGCGAAFDAVVDDDPSAPDASEAAYTAVLCYQKLYEQTHSAQAARQGLGQLPQAGRAEAGGPRAEASKPFERKELTAEQRGMVGAFGRYLCAVRPDEGDAKGRDQLVEVKFARARLLFEAHHWEEAAAAFRDVALSHPDHDAALPAAQLYLESANVLASRADPPRPACVDEMARSVPKLLAAHCEGGRAGKNAGDCAVLARVGADLEQLRAEALVKQAERAGPGASRVYEQAGAAYLDLARRCALEPIDQGKAPSCERPESLLWNAAEAFQSARLLMKSIQARRLLLEPKYKLEKTDVARKSVMKIGSAYQAIAVYDEAARWYERYARDYPRAEKAETALSDAIVLRYGLGQDDEAEKDAEQFSKAYGSSKPAEAARVAFATAAHLVYRDDLEPARKALSGAMAFIDKNATLEVRAEAHAILGRLLARAKSDAGAQAEYRKVIAVVGDPEAAAKGLEQGDDSGGKRRAGKALSALGEALFYFAEREKKHADAIAFPPYKGPADKASVLRHIEVKVKGWLGKKRAAIEAAEKAYLKVLDVKPAPPPSWVIASGSRVGGMWGGFVREFRASPVPDEIRRDDELRNAYYEALDRASEPQKQRAKAAFEACLSYAVTFQHFDEHARSCEVWLSSQYKAEYHRVDELRDAPVHAGSGLNDRAYPIDMDGKSVATMREP